MLLAYVNLQLLLILRMEVAAKHAKVHANYLGPLAVLMNAASNAIQHPVHPAALPCVHVVIVV